MKSLGFLDSEYNKQIMYLEERKLMLDISNNNLSWIKENLIEEYIPFCFFVFEDKDIRLFVEIINFSQNAYIMFLSIEGVLISDIEFQYSSNINLEECKQILLEKASLLYDLRKSICNLHRISFDWHNNHLSLHNLGEEYQDHRDKYAIYFDKNLNLTLVVENEKMKLKAEELKKKHDSILVKYEFVFPAKITHARDLYKYLIYGAMPSFVKP